MQDTVSEVCDEQHWMWPLFMMLHSVLEEVNELSEDLLPMSAAGVQYEHGSRNNIHVDKRQPSKRGFSSQASKAAQSAVSVVWRW